MLFTVIIWNIGGTDPKSVVYISVLHKDSDGEGGCLIDVDGRCVVVEVRSSEGGARWQCSAVVGVSDAEKKSGSLRRLGVNLRSLFLIP